MLGWRVATCTSRQSSVREVVSRQRQGVFPILATFSQNKVFMKVLKVDVCIESDMRFSDLELRKILIQVVTSEFDCPYYLNFSSMETEINLLA